MLVRPRAPLTLAVVISMLGVTPRATAAQPTDAPPTADGSTPPAEPTELERAQQLHSEGTVAYSASDYTTAIAKFTESLAVISNASVDVPPDTRALVLYNLGRAHDKAYGIDRDVVHLRQAADLFSRIVDEAEARGYTADTVAQAETARAEIEAKLAKAAPPPASTPTPTPPAGGTDEPAAGKPGKPLVIAGAVLTGVGVASSAIWIAGIAVGKRATDDVGQATLPSQGSDRADAIDRGHTGDTLGLAGAVVSSVLVGVGVALLVTGLVRAKRNRDPHAWVPRARWTGAAIGGRF